MSLDSRLAEALWRPYFEPIRIACRMRTPEEDPALVVAIGLRETWLGTCPGYEPKGPSGRGDGGHGRGLFQIDDRGPFKHLIAEDGEEWSAYVQAQAACTVLATAREELRGFEAFPDFEVAVVCRYNAALANVLAALQVRRDPNLVTTGKDYGRDVLQLRAQLRAAFPETFPPAAGPAAT